MKLMVQVIRNNPSNIEQIEIEDVARWELNENNLVLFYNTGKEEQIELRNNNGRSNGDWVGVSIFATRQFLTVDLSK